VVQTLEGEEGVVRGVDDTISRDPRHEQVELVETTQGVERAFTRWSMAHVSDGADADLPLSKQWEGGIDVSRPRLTTPEEDAVVSAMRDRVRGAPARAGGGEPRKVHTARRKAPEMPLLLRSSSEQGVRRSAGPSHSATSVST
jgi:hypothetical protein